MYKVIESLKYYSLEKRKKSNILDSQTKNVFISNYNENIYSFNKNM